jgi:chitodextrinase
VTGHTVNLSGLACGTTYKFYVSSTDAAGNLRKSPESTFRTDSCDSTPPKITNVAVAVTKTTARVSWTTDEPAVSIVGFGTTSPTQGVAGSIDMVTAHVVNLTGLRCNTTYKYIVASVDPFGNYSYTAESTFKTLSC